MISQSHWSLPLLGNNPKKFNLVHRTVVRWKAHAVWARDCAALLLAACVAVIFQLMPATHGYRQGLLFLTIAPSSLKHAQCYEVSSIIPKITPAYLVQAYSKIPLNRVAWNLEMSATYLETCILGI